MVTWQQFVSLVAEIRGGDVSDAAPMWNRNKQKLSQASKEEVREALRR